MEPIKATEGLLFHFIKSVRPDLAKTIEQTQKIETMIVGLGRQGTRHAKLMQEYGTDMTCGVAPGKGGTKVHETIPVYETAGDALPKHPNVAVASIWKHYSTAKEATIEVIEAGVPIVVLISEFIPLKDVRDILVAAREHGTILFGGNTPGIIFPPEQIKVGMLPDVFHPEEPESNQAGPKGVTILSRSGAILYHLSDALASEGVAQNAVLGVGGDGAIGSRFVDLVSRVMAYEHTELVVIAGEIGGMQEELLAQDIQQHPEKYTKPLVALISGANAPAGKTMGHAGAVITPGQDYGTHQSKRAQLEKAGVAVVNHQRDLIAVVKEKLEGKTYFNTDDYYNRMKAVWEKKPPAPTWGTLVTKVVPNSLLIRGYPLQELVQHKSLLEVAHLLTNGELPSEKETTELNKIAVGAALDVDIAFSPPMDEGTQLSKVLGTYLLVDEKVAQLSEDNPAKKLAYILGRMARYCAIVFKNERTLDRATADPTTTFPSVLYRALVGEPDDEAKVRLVEAMVTGSVDHGVTPPSAQTTLLLSSVRPSFEVAVAGGVLAITDVHGGAGEKAAEFFLNVAKQVAESKTPLDEVLYSQVKAIVQTGKRIEGLGHRIHTQDPRRDILWQLVEEAGLAKECVAASKEVSQAFNKAKGMNLPINVDGVIGAVVGDMGIPPVIAKAIFIFGRVAGLTAHYFEEVESQPPMRRIDFSQAEYKGPTERTVP